MSSDIFHCELGMMKNLETVQISINSTLQLQLVEMVFLFTITFYKNITEDLFGQIILLINISFLFCPMNNYIVQSYRNVIVVTKIATRRNFNLGTCALKLQEAPRS